MRRLMPIKNSIAAFYCCCTMMSTNINMNNMVALLRSRLAIGALLTANTTCPKSTNSDGDINDNHNKLLLLLLHDYHLNICCCALLRLRCETGIWHARSKRLRPPCHARRPQPRDASRTCEHALLASVFPCALCTIPRPPLTSGCIRFRFAVLNPIPLCGLKH